MTVQLSQRIKSVRIWLGGLIAIGLISGSFLYWQQRQKIVNTFSNQQTVRVERQDLASQILAGGVVQAERSTTLSPEGSGKIAELFIQEGDRKLSNVSSQNVASAIGC